MRIDTQANAALKIPNEQGAALPVPSNGGGDERSFGEFLVQALGDVNNSQQHAGEMVKQFSTGAPMDVHQVMIALEQASTTMALTVQVRNKLVEAYQDILRTQV
jgi:flagellar hook-basal body complex protein FliE